MKYEFEIIKVLWHHNRGNFIFARHLGNTHEFEVPDGSFLADIPIYNYSEEIRRASKKENQQLDMFVFRPISLGKLMDDYFKEGQRVQLIIET